MIVAVCPLAGFDKTLHYRVPAALSARLSVGSLVRMPLGRTFALGVVAEIDPKEDFPSEKLKNITELLFDFPALPDGLVTLARWIGAYYAAPLDTVIEAMIPVAVRNGHGVKTQRMLSLAKIATDDELAALRKRAPQQARLYEFLKTQKKSVARPLALARFGGNAALISSLVKRGLLTETVQRVERVAYRDELSKNELVTALPPALTAEQTTCVASLQKSLSEEKFRVHLLNGVTGSGKTEVYLRLCDEALAAGGSVIYLVPEVALTPQTVARVRSRLEKPGGPRVVVWHSHLSEGERLDGWWALASGEARIVVGARSAVFAPVQNLRLLIVDEEHEPAYKQDEAPRYHGRDVAVYRAKLAGALCVLGSATPSLETMRNVQLGRYAMDALTQRVDGRVLPTMHIVDMRREFGASRQPSTLSRALAEKLLDRFQRREQSLLFINRRGYSSSMICGECGYVATCTDCSIALTYHRSVERVKCHLCGDENPAPLQCPQCRSPKIRWRGFGTQKVEEAVSRLLPSARVVRLDTDALQRKNEFREILSEFRAGKIHVLVGTQMIAKGLDFPNVTLAGLVDADISMHIPDFRANERTFQLLVQVAGRSGRGDRAGEVVVQTFTPQADAIQFAKRSDFAGFIEAERALREKFNYPPYRHLIRHLFRSDTPEKVAFCAAQFAKKVESELAGRVDVRGPAPAPIEKIQGQYRHQLWYFTASAAKVAPELFRLQADFPWPDGLVQTLDVDAFNLM